MAKKQTNRKGKNVIPEKRINDEIVGFTKVRIIGEGIESREVSLEEAQEIAAKMEKDLIEINGNLSVPIIRIENYDKFLYEQKKMQKKAKQNKTQLKEIQLSVSIADNDLKTKANKAKEFIEDDCKVKVILTMRGRELIRREENKKSMFSFIDMMSDVAVAESVPKDEGNKTIVILKKKK